MRNLLVLATNKERRRPSVRVDRGLDLFFFGHGRSLLWCITSHRRTNLSFFPPPQPTPCVLSRTFTQSLCLVEFSHNLMNRGQKKRKIKAMLELKQVCHLNRSTTSDRTLDNDGNRSFKSTTVGTYPNARSMNKTSLNAQMQRPQSRHHSDAHTSFVHFAD